MLVFTCHDHIARLFRGLKAPLCELPSNVEHNPPPLVFDEGFKEKAKKPGRPAQAARGTRLRVAGKSRSIELEEPHMEAPDEPAEPEPVAATVPQWAAPEPAYAESDRAGRRYVGRRMSGRAADRAD